MLALLAMLRWAGIGGHQWPPDLVRLAIADDDMPMAQTAAQACGAEAAAETRPARAAAASLRCRGLLEADPAPPRRCRALPGARSGSGTACGSGGPGRRAGRTRAGRRGQGRPERGRQPLRRPAGPVGYPAGRGPASLPRYQARRARPERAALGLRPGGAHADRGQDRRLSRQGRLHIGHRQGRVLVPADAVQTCISRILTKLGATSRVEIVGEALRRGISPERDGRAVHRRESVVI